MSKLSNEKALLKKALALGMRYGESKGVVKFEATDSAEDKTEYVYRLLVHDKIITPLPREQESLPNMRHKLALWVNKLQEKVDAA
ncbi:MAG: DUF5062 family protein [Arenicella sp.]|jgi:hypothetical protein|nr:DUF5062 family protein [Arenicella sp.]HAU69205.1 DUF5062 domain-containing protein [Gammaproteobacteria bacterium]